MDVGQVIAAAIPPLGGIARIVADTRQGASWRHVEQVAKIRGTLGEESRAKVDELLAAEVEVLTSRDEARIHRKLDWAAASTIIVIVAVATGITALVWNFDTWWSYTTVVVVDVFALLLAAAGAGQLYVDGRENKADSTAS